MVMLGMPPWFTLPSPWPPIPVLTCSQTEPQFVDFHTPWSVAVAQTVPDTKGSTASAVA
jgi:hypothetical protein